jgi:hypothetical protein
MALICNTNHLNDALLDEGLDVLWISLISLDGSSLAAKEEPIKTKSLTQSPAIA